MARLRRTHDSPARALDIEFHRGYDMTQALQNMRLSADGLATDGPATLGAAASFVTADAVVLGAAFGVAALYVARMRFTPLRVLALIALKPAAVELVITGRRAPDELIAAADLATEMRPLKHYYDAGVQARPGIEF